MLEVDGATQPFGHPRQRAAARSCGERLVPRLDVVEGTGKEPRHRGHDDEVLESRVLDLALDPLEFGVADHRSTPVGEDPAAARIDDQQPDRPEIAPIRPHRTLGAVGFEVGGLGESAQRRLGVGNAPDGGVHLVGRQPGERHVAEVLVDPVRHERARDPRLPPVGLLHLATPGMRRVPVVADVVIVEDHRAGERRQEPAGGGLAPCLLIEPGVFLEVRDLGVRRPPDVAPGLDELLHRRRRVIRIHLVTDQQQEVRPVLVMPTRHPDGKRLEHVRRPAALPPERRGLTTRPEDHADRSRRVDRPDPARRVGRARLGPDRVAVDPDLVRRGSRRFETEHGDQCVVMACNREGPLPSADATGVYLDLTRGVRFDPHGRIALADMSQEGSEEESGHSEVCTTSGVDGRCSPSQDVTPVPGSAREAAPDARPAGCRTEAIA